MKDHRPFWSACRWCGTCACTFALWTLWLFLGVLLALQLYLLTARELNLPAFLVRALESRLAASHLSVHFDHATLDPSGRIMARNIRLESTAYAEPLFTARALYVRLDPWALLAGHFDPREVRVAGAGFFVPAMFSTTGQTEALVSDCDVDLIPRHSAVELAQFTCRVDDLIVTAHGALRLPANANTSATGVLPLADLFAQNYPALSRQIAGFTDELAALDEPRLHLELTPSDTRGALVTATFTAHALHLTAPWDMQATELSATARTPLLGNAAGAASLDVRAEELSLPNRTQVRRVHVLVSGFSRPGLLRFHPYETAISADKVEALSLQATNLTASLSAGHHLQLLDATTLLAGAPAGLRAEIDFEGKKAGLQFDAGLTPAVLAAIAARMHTDLTGLLTLTSPVMVHGSATVADGWRFASLSTIVEARHLDAQGVPVDAVRAQVDLSGHDLRATNIVLHQGDNLALGSYTMDTATNDYRFLLHGRLRPANIAGWFADWWSDFWKKFDFPTAPPAADIDVHGRWGAPETTDIFVFADASSLVFRGIPLDRVRILLRWQPPLYDCRELFVTQGARTARGRFTRSIDVVKDSWSNMEFDGTSNLDLVASARIVSGKEGEDFVEPFKFAQPPTLHVTGRLDSPVSPDGEHQLVQLAVASAGVFALYDFPINDVSFDATLRDNDIDLPRINATFAGGALAGRAFMTGADSVRRLRFDLHLANAGLGQTIGTVDEFLAKQNHQPPDPPTKFVQHADDIRLDLTATGEGRYHDPLSFTGNGTLAIAGSELTQIRLFGALSRLLSFTSLRFTAARANFNIAQNRLVFPDVKVTGANSAIDAKGDYSLDKKNLDFNAKIYPFGESKFVVSNLADKLLTPLSAALEVKLTGKLDDPAWAFVYGPTNFWRELTKPKPDTSVEKTAPAAAK